MVAHLVRLKLTILGNGLRRSTWQVVGLVVTLLYALGVLVAVLAGLGALSFADAELRGPVLTLAGALLVLGWWVVPLIAFGADATLDPDRFALFPVRPRSLVVGLALAALVGVPGLVTTAIAVGSALSWWSAPAALVVGLVGAVLGVATCVLGSRALTTSLSHLVGGRRFREVMTIVVLVPVMLLGPILNGLTEGVRLGADLLPAAASVAGWTPMGAPWALAADAARGDWVSLLLRLVLSMVVVLLLAYAWQRALATALVRPRRESSARVRTEGLGAFGRMPGTATGAIAGRALTYWIRDPRYASSVVIIPLLPVLAWFIGGGTDGVFWLAVGPVTGYVLGWAISADVAFDSTAFWTHVAAPVRGHQDRRGRVLAALVVGVPVSLVMTLVTVALSGRWSATAPLVALTLGVFLTALGVASVLSARVVYPVPKPGDNPFSSPQGGGAAAMISQLVGTTIVTVLIAPTVGLTIAALVTGSVWLALAAVVVGPALGIGVLLLGIRMGGRLYDRTAPALLQSLVSMA